MCGAVLERGGVSRFAWTSVKPEQSQKQYIPITVTELGIVMLVKPEQPKKHSFPILVTELGIVMLVKPEQSQNLQVVLYQRLVC